MNEVPKRADQSLPLERPLQVRPFRVVLENQLIRNHNRDLALRAKIGVLQAQIDGLSMERQQLRNDDARLTYELEVDMSLDPIEPLSFARKGRF